jgi:hypothetical protein
LLLHSVQLLSAWTVQLASLDPVPSGRGLARPHPLIRCLLATSPLQPLNLVVGSFQGILRQRCFRPENVNHESLRDEPGSGMSIAVEILQELDKSIMRMSIAVEILQELGKSIMRNEHRGRDPSRIGQKHHAMNPLPEAPRPLHASPPPPAV